MSVSLNISNISFKNKYTVYEKTIKCTIKDYEYNTSTNPTLRSGSNQYLYLTESEWIESTFLPSSYTGSYYFNPNSTLKSFVTSSDFTPYVSTIGLYNDSNQLLAVAKLAQPLPLSTKTDTTFIIKFDF
jgi:hypothetical protein